jgi:hypothetical protein
LIGFLVVLRESHRRTSASFAAYRKADSAQAVPLVDQRAAGQRT